jgi:RHS repeat-associated protein
MLTSYARSAVSGYPTDNTTVPNDSLARVNGNGPKTGPSLLLKVMSGDVVDIATKSFYKSGGIVNSPNSILTDVINSLAGGIVTSTSGAHGVVTDLTNSSTGPVYAAVNAFLPTNDPNTVGKPKAYLNWILLDDQFRGVTTYPQSGAIVVGSADVLNTLAYSGIPITKNGYLYIWVSNETPGWDVFFDNLSVKHYTGPISEETHYYPFGLTMAGISSKAAGGLENNRKFNDGTELNNNFDISLYETDFRSYDPQIGRFVQIDELADYDYRTSPYTYANNNPILINDPLGLQSDTAWKPLSPVVVTAKPKSSSVGQPGFGESLIPVWGSGRAAIDDFQNGRWGWGIFNTVMAVSDAFLIKSAITAIGKLAVKGAAEIAAKEGVYELTTTGGKYIGQSKNFLKRIAQHFGKGGKMSAVQLEKALLHEMAGSTKLEREVYEQYLIREAGGVDVLVNKVNPMGGRMDVYEKMIDGVIEKFNLPK